MYRIFSDSYIFLLFSLSRCSLWVELVEPDYLILIIYLWFKFIYFFKSFSPQLGNGFFLLYIYFLTCSFYLGCFGHHNNRGCRLFSWRGHGLWRFLLWCHYREEDPISPTTLILIFSKERFMSIISGWWVSTTLILLFNLCHFILALF